MWPFFHKSNPSIFCYRLGSWGYWSSSQQPCIKSSRLITKESNFKPPIKLRSNSLDSGRKPHWAWENNLVSSSELESNRELSSEETKVLNTLSSITKKPWVSSHEADVISYLFFYFYLFFIYQIVKMRLDTFPQNLLHLKQTCFSFGHRDYNWK